MAFSIKLGSLTDELVEVIANTTTETDPARFDALRESSLRKLRQHNYLRANQFEVYASLDGYEERFRVLNRDPVADALRARLDALANCSNKWTPDVLRLLLELADQPVQKTNLRDLESLKSPEPLELRLKWSDIAKEEGWDKNDELWRNAELAGYTSEDYVDHESDKSVRSEDTSLSSIEARFCKKPGDYSEPQQDQLGFEEVCKSQAWRRREPVKDPTIQPPKITITEIQVIREVLFMLGGLENSLFNHQGTPLLDVQLTHASWQIFRSLLVSANRAGRSLSLLRRYVKQHQTMPLLQVFRAAIEDRLRSFDNSIAGMQARYVHTERDIVASLITFFDELQPHLTPLKSLADTIEKLEKSKNHQPFYYLELLFDSAQSLQLEDDESTYRFISQIFFECFAVYLRPIRLWMQNGELIDGDKTFFVARSPADVSWSQAWTHQFKLKKTSQGSLFAPRFLQPAASKIFATGKSIVILKLLGKHWPTHEEAPEHTALVDMSTISELVPFPEVFKGVFDEWMQQKHHAASGTLKQTLFETYNLWSELDMLRHIYLMSDGSRSDGFANTVFRNIDTFNAYWHDRFNLTEIAREAFDGLIEPHRLNASTLWHGSVPDVSDVRQTVREGLSSIRITYRLPWLSQIVLSDESMDHYQLIFTFLLQLRRARYVLTRHRIISDGLAYATTEQEIFYGLRSRLLWFCNTLQSYLSTLVLGPLVGKFLEEMREAEDIDGMITSHAVFTKRMRDEACLGGKLDLIRQAMLDIFDLAIRLQNAHRRESERMADETQELSRLSVMSTPRRHQPRRYVRANEEDEETVLSEQDKGVMMQDADTPYGQILSEIRSDLDRHLKFICGGLRGVARATSSGAAGKWDILAEMLEVGVRGIQ